MKVLGLDFFLKRSINWDIWLEVSLSLPILDLDFDFHFKTEFFGTFLLDLLNIFLKFACPKDFDFLKCPFLRFFLSFLPWVKTLVFLA